MPSEQYKKEESKIQKALEAYRQNPKQKIAKLAREFDVPYKRLWQRVQSNTSQLNRRPAHKRLSDDQERAVIVWINDLDDRGVPPTVRMIKNYAEKVLQNMYPDADPPPYLGDRWVHRFLKRLGKEYKKQKQKTMDPKRHLAEDPNVIQAWFDRLEIAIQKYEITPSNLWNFDESGFQIGQGDDEEVITKYPEALRHVPSSSSRELVSTIEGINAVGNAIPPLLIFTGKVILESWFEYLKEDEWKVTISDSGFSNDEIAYEWLKHFNEHTREQAGNNFRLLIMDNHTAHLTTEFISYCDENRILPFAFPPHTTHILQPLDGMPFLHYKRIHRRAINEQAHLGGYFYDKIDFLANIAHIRAEALTPRVIRKGFSERGIWPLNPDLVIEPLMEKWDVQMGQDLQIFDGSLTQAHIMEQQQAQINRLQELNQRKSAKKTKRQVQVGGILSVKDANRAIKKRATQEELKAERKRLRELQNVPLGLMPPPLTTSDEAALDRNSILNLVEQAYPRRSDPNLIRWVEDRM